MPLTPSIEPRAKIFDFVEEKIGLGLWVWDYATNRMQWSDGIFKLLEIPSGSVEPSLGFMRSLIHPEDLLTMDAVFELVDRQMSIDRDLRLVLPNGRTKWVHNYGELVVAGGGQQKQMVGYLIDITARKEKELSVSFFTNRREALVRDAYISIWSASRDGSRSRIPGWQDWTGQTAESAQNFGWLQQVHPDDRERVQTARRHSIANGEPYMVRFRLKTKDGAFIPVHSRAALVRNEVHQEDEWVGILMRAVETENVEYDTAAISGLQVRAARAILNWSVSELAERAQVSISSVRRVEEYDGVSQVRDATLSKIRSAIEKCGIDFVDLGGGSIGVQVRRPGS